MNYKYIVEVKAQAGQLPGLVATFNSQILPAIQAHPLYVDADTMFDPVTEVAIVIMVTASPCPGAAAFTEQQLDKVPDLVLESQPVREFKALGLGAPYPGEMAN